MTETVLVTGGTGFIGQWCIVELLRRGYDVRTTIRKPEKEASVRAAVSTQVDPGARLTCVVADLTVDDGWAEAMAGCDHVLHVASPLGTGRPGDPDYLIIPARDGTRRVLRAAIAAGVQRVVMTSAANTASPTSYTEDGVTDETLWTDPDAPGLQAYRRSKTLAERAAWAVMAEAPGATTLATVLPGAVFGPILSTGNIGSVAVIGRMLTGAMPGTPRIGLEVVDVRDLVDLHLRAMTSPLAAGERFLGTGEFLWMSEIAAILRSRLGAEAGKVPTRSLPNLVVRVLARFRPELRGILPGLGRRNRHSTKKAEAVLGWKRRPAEETIVDCARSLLDRPARPPVTVRKDAARNRARLVEAAREVFAERGLHATLDDVAERAGVGTGTAYRHFSNKRELAAEVLGDATRQIVTDAEAALAIDDPWRALVSFFETTAERQAADRGLYDALAGYGRAEDKTRLWPEIVDSVTELFDRARAAGVIRADAAPEDAASIFAMLGVTFAMGERGSGDLWRRYLGLMLDGLRATDRPPLPVAAPTFTTLDDVIAVGKGSRTRR